MRPNVIEVWPTIVCHADIVVLLINLYVAPLQFVPGGGRADLLDAFGREGAVSGIFWITRPYLWVYTCDVADSVLCIHRRSIVVVWLCKERRDVTDA